MNQIGGSTIDMTQTDRPIVGTDGEEATIMQPGSTHQFNGPVTETTLQSLEEMEPDLLEAHLSTLSDEDQEEFVEKYVQLDENMRMTALTQMFKKHKNKVKMQAGGFTYTPSSDFLPDGYVLTDVITNSPDKTNTVKPGKPQSESLPKSGKPTQRKQIKAKPVPAAPVAKPVQAAPLTNKVTEGRITLPTVTIRPEPQVSETSKLVGYASGNLPFLGRTSTRFGADSTINYDQAPTTFVDSETSKRFQSLGKYSTKEDMGLREILYDPSQQAFLQRTEFGKYKKIPKDQVMQTYPGAYEKIYGPQTNKPASPDVKGNAPSNGLDSLVKRNRFKGIK